MHNIKISLWGILALLTALWLAVDPSVFRASTFFAVRGAMVQYSGLLGMACMSVAMILALRPRWAERWFDGLDKMYRLHKWLGIGALVISITHWLWAKGPKWAVGWGWLERPQRGPRQPPDNVIEQLLSGQRRLAEDVGEWAFYAAIALIVLALITRFPYRLFFKTHRLLAVAYLVLVFHAVVLIKFAYWTTPIGLVMAPLLAGGTWAAIVVLLRRVGAGRKVRGTITALPHHPHARTLEAQVAVPHGWPGHRAGQFAFGMSDPAEGAHPYTIASAWDGAAPRLTFMIKELGDHTTALPHKLRIGQSVTIEGPYGCFTFDDGLPQQIWVAGGIGITPFLARLEELAAMDEGRRPTTRAHLFYCTAEEENGIIARLRTLAQAAGVELHVLVSPRDGLLTGERIRALVPQWRDAGLWFCGPAGFGQALRRDFAAQGMKVSKRFHQELFAMR